MVRVVGVLPVAIGSQRQHAESETAAIVGSPGWKKCTVSAVVCKDKHSQEERCWQRTQHEREESRHLDGTEHYRPDQKERKQRSQKLRNGPLGVRFGLGKQSLAQVGQHARLRSSSARISVGLRSGTMVPTNRSTGESAISDGNVSMSLWG